MVLFSRNNVDCQYVDFANMSIPFVERLDHGKYHVIKTHDFENVRKLGAKFKRPLWVFSTAGPEARAAGLAGDSEALTAQFGNNSQFPLKYVQVLSSLSMRGYFLVGDYASIFGLGEEDKKKLLHYIRFWSVLRQCCGAQLSADWRSVLQGGRPTHHSPFDPSNPFCETYDIDAVESTLLQSDITKQMREKKVKAGKYASYYPESLPEFNGTYCSWFNRQIKCQKLQFNEFPKKPYC